MKHVWPIALLGALAAGPAFAAGMDKESGQSSSYQSDQTTAQSGQSATGATGATGAADQQQSAAPGGMQGAAADEATVREIQQALKEKGYEVGEVDGIVGENTRQALMKFQQDQGMQATGDIDQQTLAALEVEGEAATQQGQVPAGEPGVGGAGAAGGAQQMPETGGGAGGDATGGAAGGGATGGGSR